MPVVGKTTSRPRATFHFKVSGSEHQITGGHGGDRQRRGLTLMVKAAPLGRITQEVTADLA